MQKSFEQKLAEAQTAVSAITPEQANEAKKCNPHALFIDPRSSEDIESTTGRIPGALSLPLDSIDQQLNEQLAEELELSSRPIITACQGGPMGALAAHALLKRGYQNVFYIEGGTQGWIDAGFATV